MRYMGLDFGSKTVGVALSDPLGLTVYGLEIIRRTEETHLRRTLRRIEEIAGEYEVEAIVLGYPLNMDDSVGERAEKTLAFRDQLVSRLHLPVYMSDERLTTVAAEENMAERGIRREDYKKYVDRVAASIILEDWIGAHS